MQQKMGTSGNGVGNGVVKRGRKEGKTKGLGEQLMKKPEPRPGKAAATRQRESGSHVKYKKSDEFAAVAD